MYGPSDKGDIPMDAINGVRKCRVGVMRLCVTSEPEMTKCVRMRTALNAQLLEPKMSCKKAKLQGNLAAYVLCGSDGKTYVDHCDLKAANCRSNTNVSIKHTGICQEEPEMIPSLPGFDVGWLGQGI